MQQYDAGITRHNHQYCSHTCQTRSNRYVRVFEFDDSLQKTPPHKRRLLALPWNFDEPPELNHLSLAQLNS